MKNNYKNEIISIGRLLWSKDLVSGLNGNISVRIDDKNIGMTCHGSCLGLLDEKDVLKLNMDGEVEGEGQVSTEKLLHTQIYRNFPETKAIIHTHTNYVNGYFLENTKLVPKIFETKVFLGAVESIEQTTPAVTDVSPVLESLKNNNVVVLRKHGVIARGNELFDCFLLVQALEDAIKVDAVNKLYKNDSEVTEEVVVDEADNIHDKKFKLFSQEQIDEIVSVVNNDPQMKALGESTDMTMELAVKLDETGKVYSFDFEKGRIARVGENNNAEFLINANEQIWRAVFNGEIDPFVATTQKKMNLKGDFAKISKWYAPCSRIFELWAQVPVE